MKPLCAESPPLFCPFPVPTVPTVVHTFHHLGTPHGSRRGDVYPHESRRGDVYPHESREITVTHGSRENTVTHGSRSDTLRYTREQE